MAKLLFYNSSNNNNCCCCCCCCWEMRRHCGLLQDHQAPSRRHHSQASCRRVVTLTCSSCKYKRTPTQFGLFFFSILSANRICLCVSYSISCQQITLKCPLLRGGLMHHAVSSFILIFICHCIYLSIYSVPTSLSKQQFVFKYVIELVISSLG